MATPIPANSAPLTVWSAAAATGGRVVRAGEGDVVARGITSDSRAVRPGSAFVALRGEHPDGHAYLESAVKAGACLVIVEDGGAAVDVPAGALASGAVDVVAVPDT